MLISSISLVIFYFILSQNYLLCRVKAYLLETITITSILNRDFTTSIRTNTETQIFIIIILHTFLFHLILNIIHLYVVLTPSNIIIWSWISSWAFSIFLRINISRHLTCSNSRSGKKCDPLLFKHISQINKEISLLIFCNSKT